MLSESEPSGITEAAFGAMPDSRAASIYTLWNDGPLRVAITNFGGAIVSLWVPDRHGVVSDVVLGYDTLAGYLAGKSFFGGIIGRFGNRIARGKFTIDGVEYSLPLNNGENHLHGGPLGFDRVLWKGEVVRDAAVPTLRLERTSPDGEQGYPGNLKADVTYSLPTEDTLRIDYGAQTDQPTPVNLTNHSYFNLGGHDSGDTILDHNLMLASDYFTPTNAGLIPTSELKSVAATPFDFRELLRIGERIGVNDEQLRFAGGYDHNFVLRRSGDSLELAARLCHPQSGRAIEVSTTEPGIQFYSGNFLNGAEVGKNGVAYAHRTGLCLETQHFPDSPNQPKFPTTILRPGRRYASTTLYRFLRGG